MRLAEAGKGDRYLYTGITGEENDDEISNLRSLLNFSPRQEQARDMKNSDMIPTLRKRNVIAEASNETRNPDLLHVEKSAKIGRCEGIPSAQLIP